MTPSLHGQTVVITGAARGLGRAVAVGLAGEGARMCLCDHSAEELRTTACRIRTAGAPDPDLCDVDLSTLEGCRQLLESLARDYGHVDVLVNNAAVLDLRPLDDVTDEDWNETIAVNLTAPFRLTRGLLPRMRESGGSVINVSSRAGVEGFAHEAPYCASKFGLEGMTRAVARECEGLPVSINTVTPGLRIKPTQITDAEAAEMPDEARASWNDPGVLVPAFAYLARLRGELTGLRFDAYRLATALAAGGDLAPACARELAE